MCEPVASGVAPPGDNVAESSLGADEEASGVVEDEESTLLLLEGGATLGDFDELKYPPPPGFEKAEYALRAPAAGRSRCARTDIANDEEKVSWWDSATLTPSLRLARPRHVQQPLKTESLDRAT